MNSEYNFGGKTDIINAIYININDLYPNFSEKYKFSIYKLLNYLDYYCLVMRDNDKEYFNEIKIKDKVERFFEEESNWNLPENESKERILKKLLTPTQFELMKSFEHNVIDWNAPDGGGSRKYKKSKKHRKHKKSRRHKKTRRHNF
jgi:hypothetical protein